MTGVVRPLVEAVVGVRIDHGYPLCGITSAGSGERTAMTVGRVLHRAGVRGAQLQWFSLGSVGFAIALWLRAKTVDQDERGNAERRAIFVGLWPSMFWLIGDAMRREEKGARS
ncbi:hypothetical protein Ae717Ps2_3427 [Pseudonocardia sp. Ae717_Ps2]|nr:hypothetical protein Ae717Ps2_3427 [Pseudonocardia sp. Ae717_Ps2]